MLDGCCEFPMPVNAVAENVLGTIGMSVSLYIHPFTPNSYQRDNLVDCATCSPSMEKLASAFHFRLITLACVRELMSLSFFSRP